MPVRVLFVCLGNICRSPTAEGVMRSLLRETGMEREVQIDSAGTGSWHVGSPPDSRAAEAAQARGITLEGAARSVTEEDFEEFDLIIAMDRENRSALRQIAPSEEARQKVHLLREFDPASKTADLDVPDPYYGAPDGFDQVLNLVHAACEGLLEEIRAGNVPTGRAA